MKQNSTRCMAALALACVSLTGFSQITENFNTRENAQTFGNVRFQLQNQGWFFWYSSAASPVIEGDLSFQTAQLNGGQEQISGFATPIAEFNGNDFTVEFKYKNNTTLGTRRWFLVALTDNDYNVVQLLDSVEVSDISTAVKTYSNTFSGITGSYKLQFLFRGTGGNARFVYDEVNITEITPLYPGGSNSAPVGVDDTFFGTPQRTATGNVLANDSDPDGETLSAYLLQGPTPSQGTVTLNTDGSFSFTPAEGFMGSGIAFTYSVCDNGTPQLCTGPVQVLVNFPAGGVTPVMMLDFNAVYSNNNVILNWSTATELNNARFEIMRSENGTDFVKVGEVAGRGTVTSITTYSHRDAVAGVSAPILHYKLRQVDTDGKFEFTNTVVVRLNADAKVLASVAPNPVVGAARLTVQLDQKADVQVRILSNLGKELARKTLKGMAGTNAFTLDETNRLINGLYFIEVVVDGKERSLIKIVK